MPSRAREPRGLKLLCVCVACFVVCFCSLVHLSTTWLWPPEGDEARARLLQPGLSSDRARFRGDARPGVVHGRAQKRRRLFHVRFMPVPSCFGAKTYAMADAENYFLLVFLASPPPPPARIPLTVTTAIAIGTSKDTYWQGQRSAFFISCCLEGKLCVFAHLHVAAQGT